MSVSMRSDAIQSLARAATIFNQELLDAGTDEYVAMELTKSYVHTVMMMEAKDELSTGDRPSDPS